MWLPIDDALSKYAQYTHLITASKYILPFNPASENAVKMAFSVDGELGIFSKTPNIGSSWSSHPVFRYTLDSPSFFGEKSIFAKVSSYENVLEEIRNLVRMKERLDVPLFRGIFENKNPLRG
jgi:hypothetical protein